jgi:hypothetical protein
MTTLKIIDIRTHNITEPPATAVLFDPALLDSFTPYWLAVIVTSDDTRTGTGDTEAEAIADAEVNLRNAVQQQVDAALSAYWTPRGQGIY